MPTNVDVRNCLSADESDRAVVARRVPTRRRLTERLAGTQDPSVIVAACNLAVVTGDPAHRRRVQQVANQQCALHVDATCAA